MEREKNPLIKLLCTADHDAAVHGGATTVSTANNNGAIGALPLGEIDTERAYVPSVGRWGCEWPS